MPFASIFWGPIPELDNKNSIYKYLDPVEWDFQEPDVYSDSQRFEPH